MTRAGYLALAAFALLTIATFSNAQVSFTEDWESTNEWSSAVYGSNALKGEVNSNAFCGHFNDDPTAYGPSSQASCGGSRAGLWRAVSHSSVAGPPNEAWAWRLVSVDPDSNYELRFEATGDGTETAVGTNWFFDFGVTLDTAATYGGSGGTLGTGLPNGFQGATGLSSHVSAGGPAGWQSFSVLFTTGPSDTQVKIWGVAQNIDGTDTDVFAGMFIDCIELDKLSSDVSDWQLY